MAASLLFASPPLPSRAAEAGAWENFNSVDNARAWVIYNDFTGLNYYLPFNAGQGGNGFGYFTNRDDYILWFYSHPSNPAGGGKFIGNYATANVRSVIADIYIDSPQDLFGLECSVITTGPFGKGDYFSIPIYGEEFSEPGWYTLEFSFDFPWVFYDAVGEPHDVAVDTQFLSNITEIGFYYTPLPGTTRDSIFAIDNLKLEPRIAPPAITYSVSEGNFSMSFIPGNGVTCYIEKMLLPPDSGWEVLPEHFDLTGITPHVFTTPVMGKEFFRVDYEPIFTTFVTPPFPPP